MTQPRTTSGPLSAEEAAHRRVPQWVYISIIGVLVAISLIPVALSFFDPHFHGLPYNPPRHVQTFELPRADDSGTFRPQQTYGRVAVYYFGFTSCPDVCPSTLLDLRRAVELLPADLAADLDVIFISIDPERDTPEILSRYLDAFNEDFIGLYGTEDELLPAYEAFSVTVRKVESAGGGLTHSTSLYVVDRAGMLRLRIGHHSEPDVVARDLCVLLHEDETGSKPVSPFACSNI